jgi:hypothetical protein
VFVRVPAIVCLWDTVFMSCTCRKSENRGKSTGDAGSCTLGIEREVNTVVPAGWDNVGPLP